MRIPTCFRGVGCSDKLHERSLNIGELLLSFSFFVLPRGLGQDVLFEGQVANLYCLAALSLHTGPEFVGSINDVQRGVDDAGGNNNWWAHRCIEQSINRTV